MDKLVSIIIPVYNVECYIDSCISSVLAQTYTKLEIIIIDDGSTDQSGQICDLYALKDKRIKVVHQKNQGLGPARNRGIMLSQGDFLYFLDSDDYIHPDCIRILYTNIISENVSLVLGNYQKVYSYCKPETIKEYKKEFLDKQKLINLLFDNKSYKLLDFNESNFIVAWNKLYKRELFENIFFRNMYYEDVEFSTAVMLKVDSALIINETLYYFFQRPSSITHEKATLKKMERVSAYSYALSRIPSKNTMMRGLCLKRLYRIIINTQYLLSSTTYKAKSEECIRQYLKRYNSEFYLNTFISPLFKFRFIFFYKLPIAYRLFIQFCELISKVRLKMNNIKEQ